MVHFTEDNILRHITLSKSLKLCEAAIAEAIATGIAISVSVVDSGTNLVAMQRMENAILLSIEASKGKAVASVYFASPSGDLVQRNESPVMKALQIQMQGRFILGQGALPIYETGVLVGAVGVSGGTSQQDEDCARTALNKTGLG